MRYIFSLLFIALSVTSFSQQNHSASLRLGDQSFNDMRYSYAIPFYKSYLTKHEKDTAALLRLGYCYKINNVYDSAIHYYELAENFGAAKTNVLAELYASSGNYAKAITAYQALLDASKRQSSGMKSVYKSRLEGFKNMKKWFRDSLNYKLYNLSINTPFNEYNAVMYNGGIVFESNRDNKINRRNEFAWDGSAFAKLYYIADTAKIRTDSIATFLWTDKHIKKAIAEYSVLSSNDNNKWIPKFDLRNVKYDNVSVPVFSNGLDVSVNYGAICFTNDGNTAYFTKNQKNRKGENRLEIWQADKNKEGKWEITQKLSLGNPMYSYFHPAITADGNRLYFASDVPGGFGGTDIYYTEKNDGKWSDPINAGAIINTAANELFPTVYEGILYFSSNGHDGLGGLDIYKFEGKDLKNGKVVNLGYPVNTNKDEFGFSKYQNKGYISSNRYGSDDIFEFDYELVKIIIKGKVQLSGFKANDKAMVKLFDKNADALNDKSIDSSFIDKDGNYSFAVKPGIDYELDYAVIGYEKPKASYNFITDQYKKVNDVYVMDIPLIKLENIVPKVPVEVAPAAPKPAENKNKNGMLIDGKEIVSVAEQYMVFYDYDKNLITPQYEKTLDSVLNYLNAHPALVAVIGSFTDCAGSKAYNEKLSARRSAAVIAYLTKKGLKRNRIIEGHYGKEYLLKACDEAKYNPSEQWQNRRTEILASEVRTKRWTDMHKEKK